MSYKDKNVFGGANPNGLYVPMSETEQEVLARLVASDDLEVVVQEWGVVAKPRVTFGDLRVCVQFRMDFDRPAAPMTVQFFDLELRTRSGITLFKERQPTLVNGKPIQVAAGVFLDLVWDIALSHMDPKLVKALKPGAVGLTSRRLDKETGEATFAGNMRLSNEQKTLLRRLEQGQKQIKKDRVAKLATK